MFVAKEVYTQEMGVVKGKMAKLRDLLIAVVICLWCLAQLPEILLGMIFPLSVTKYWSVPKFL
jgi:hypothetical protein